MSGLDRRDFLKKAAVASAVGSAAVMFGCSTDNKQGGETSGYSGKTFQWRMVTAWPPHFPILGEGAEQLAKDIEIMSGGRLKIQVYGGGELVPPLETFDAVSQGTAEMGHSSAYYWAGKIPATPFFSSLPFGMNTQQTNTWFYANEGLKLWEETYKPFNLIPMPCGNSGAQMGGWFNKEINSIADLKGLKMRQPGLGGKVITKAGASAILTAGSEIYTNLERGVIDAADWIGPYHDYLMGFPKIAKYYYYPTWTEPTGVIELIINKNAFESLPPDLQDIVRQAAYSSNIKMLSAFEAKNQEYYIKLKEEGKVQFRKFPDDVIATFKKYTKEVLAELTASDPMSKKVFDSYSKFQAKIYNWSELAEVRYPGLS